MKTTYWLVTAAAVAAAGVTIYARLTAGDPPLPKVPAVAEAPRDIPELPLPPIVMPPDEPLEMPAVPGASAGPSPLPGGKADTHPAPSVPTVPTPPVTPASGTDPVVPPAPQSSSLKLPAVPASPPKLPVVADPPPFEPLVPPVPKPPVLPEKPAPPVTPAKPPTPLVTPLPPTPVAPPPGPAPVLQPPVPAKPQPLPAAVGDAGPREPLAVVGKYVVLKDDKLIAGAASVTNDTVVVRQGALDRPFPKSQVQYIAADKDEVYRFMLAKVSANDAAARLKVARWCMFSGLREQALAEAREVQKLQPANRTAADMVRSLELSLQQFPPEDAAKMTPPAVPTFPAELGTAPARPTPPAAIADPEPDVTPEAALVFGARVQPFLANQCVECHAKPDYAGKFKLVRVTPQDAGPQATRANLRAVAGQLRKDDPASSALLLKALSAHGGMKFPAVASRQAAAYLSLEGWAALAVGTPIAAPVAPVPPVSPVPPTPPVSPVADPTPPTPPASPVSPLPPVDPVLPLPNPPVAPVPALPTPPKAPAVPSAPDPLLPPAAVPAPLPKPVVPAIPPAVNLAPIPPAPKPSPGAPPFIPPADAGVKPMPIPVPAIPPIPPAAGAPKSPSGVVPASGTRFGSAIPPKPPVTGPSGDEFDPADFNQQRK